MNFRKNSKGITLIALVITIIVLLILAGVSLSLIMGNDGILGRAENATIEHNIASVEEDIQLAIADLTMAYYDNEDVNAGEGLNEYVARKLNGHITQNGAIIQIAEGEGEVELTYTSSGKITTGKFNTATSGVTISGVTSGGSGNTGENGGTPTPEPEPEPTKYTVTYNANGGTGNVPTSAEHEEGKNVTVDFATVPEKVGFEFLGWATTADATTATYTSSGTTSFTMGTSNVALYAVWKEETQTFAKQITKDNYGEYVDLGTTVLPRTDGVITQKLGGEKPTEQPLTDWRIFYKDDNGVYLILTDYLPYSYEATLGTGLNKVGSRIYSWMSETSRKDLINRLKGTASDFEGVNPWNKLIDNDKKNYIAKGIKVTGAVELETWVNSWNEMGYIKLYTATNKDGEYYIGTNENPSTTTKDITSYRDGKTLYFPHTNTVSYCWGYWLASPSAYASYYTMCISYTQIYFDGYGEYSDGYNSVRPAVYIPSNIKAKKVNGVWELEV